MRYLILILFFHPFIVNSQKNLDFGEVKADSNFNCVPRTMMVRDSFPFGVGEICDSKNYMEIRLKSLTLRGQNELIILSYDNNKWGAKRYVVKPGRVSRVLETTVLTEDRNDNAISFYLSSIFDSLKKNNIFLLPDQTALKDTVQYNHNHASNHIIAFKAGDKFRRYKYNNLLYYFENFPDIPEYKNLKAIIAGIQSVF